MCAWEKERGFGKCKCWKSIPHWAYELNSLCTKISATGSISVVSEQFELFGHINTGLPLGAIDALQSDFNAKPKGETVLHPDVGFLPRLPQRPGVYQIPMEMCLQELRATKHQDDVFSRFSFIYWAQFVSWKCEIQRSISQCLSAPHTRSTFLKKNEIIKLNGSYGS